MDERIMKFKLILFGMIILCLIGNVNAYYCYQETANILTPCGGLDTGSYIGSGAWNDGDWNTYSSWHSSSGTVYVNYTIPLSATNKSFWQEKERNGCGDPSCDISSNITLPQQCWNIGNISLKLYFHYASFNDYFDAYCYNGTGWYNFRTVALSGSGQFYEEAMNWDINTTLKEISQTFNANSYELTDEQFKLNVTYDSNSYPIATANLIYNGTSYASTSSLLNNFNNVFTSNINIPTINQGSVNKSFYWVVSLTNTTGTYLFNSSFNNQTINQIYLGNCGGSNSSLALNITNYDQQTLNRITPFNFKSTLNYYIGNNSLYKTAVFNDLDIIEKTICINLNTTFHITGQIEYSVNSTYETSNYYFVNTLISNSTTNLNLLSLPIVSTNIFTVKLLDQYNLPVKDYYINVNRYYPGLNRYLTVQTLKTDSSGQSTAFIEINNIQYQFEVLDTNGNIVFTSENKVITPQTSPYTINININVGIPNNLQVDYSRNITGLTYSLSYDKSSKIITYAYADSYSSFTQAELIVFQTTGNSNTLICDNNLTNSNGVITCDVSNYTGSFSAQAYNYRNNQKSLVDNLLFDITNFNAGALGIFGGICILIICMFFFSFNEVAGIVMMNVGVIAVNFMGLINFGWVVITGIVGISIIILIVLERG